jgi:hypothetical protein
MVGKRLKTFGSRIFFLIFVKSISWFGFSFGFLVVLNLFINVLFKVISNLKFTAAVLSKTPAEAVLYHEMASCEHAHPPPPTPPK